MKWPCARWQRMGRVSRAGVGPIANLRTQRTRERARATAPPPPPCRPASPPRHSPRPLRAPRWVGGESGHAQSGVLPLPGPGHRLLERAGPSPGKPGPPGPPSPRCRRPNPTKSIPAPGGFRGASHKVCSSGQRAGARSVRWRLGATRELDLSLAALRPLQSLGGRWE